MFVGVWTHDPKALRSTYKKMWKTHGFPRKMLHKSWVSHISVSLKEGI